MFCIYHNNCIDGLMAAGVVKHLNPHAVFYPGNYGEAPPIEELRGKEVIIVDFSYPLAQIREIEEAAYSLVILDHHKTAAEALQGTELKRGAILFDMERSGAGLAWDYLFGLGTRPKLVDMVEDRDLWRFKIPNSRVLHLALACATPSPDVFQQLIFQSLQDPDFVNELVDEGVVMEKQFKSQLRTLKKEAFTGCIGGYYVPMVNVPYIFASELAGELADGHHFAATYFYNGDQYIFSLRSRGEFDVSAVAKALGGGGHKNSAGFKVKSIEPFLV